MKQILLMIAGGDGPTRLGGG